jgi:polyisoprenoid-binding protein YceI
MIMRNTVALAFGLLIGLSLASAQTTWKSDLSHSRVDFSVSHLVIAEVTGRFTQFDVTLQQGKEDFSDSKLEATIKTASINTDNETRDKHLKSDDFLNADKFPDITFKSTSFEKTGKDTYKITGDLTIRDVTKTVVLDAKYNGSVTDPWGNVKSAFKATTSVNRFDYGVKWNKAMETGGLVAGDTVNITLLVELGQKKAGSPS